MPRDGFPVDRDPAPGHGVAQRGRRVQGWIVQRQNMRLSRTFRRERAPDAQLPRSGFALDVDFPLRAGAHQIVDLVKLQRRIDSDAGRIAGQHAQPESVVVDGQGADRSAVLPDCVVQAPSIGIGFPHVGGIVTDDISVDAPDAPGGHLGGEVLDGLQAVAGRRIQAIGQLAAG